MADLETRIHAWVDHQNTGVQPVTLDEIHERATTIPLDADPLPQPPRRFHLRPLAIAAAILLIAATIGAALLLTDNNEDNDVITDTEQGLDRLATLIPDDLDDLDGMVQLVDQEALLDQTGIERPAPGSSVEEAASYLIALSDQNRGVNLLPTEMAQVFGRVDVDEALVAFRDEMGIELEQITGWADWGTAGDHVTIMIGTFDETAVDAAARSNDWPGEMTEHEYRGVTYYGWGDEYTVTVSEASTTNHLGETRRIAVIDDIYIVTMTTPHMEAAIDRALDGRSAADLTGAQAVLWALLDATSEQPPEQAVVFSYDNGAFTYAATAHRRALSTSTERLGAYAMTAGIDSQLPADDIDDEVNRLIQELATTAGPLLPEPPEPDDPSFDEMYDYSVDGRILTITRADRTP